MSWVRLEKAVAAKPLEGAKLALRVGSTRSSLLVTLPSAQCGARGWDKHERLDAFFGEGDHAGQIMLIAKADGLLPIKRYKSAVMALLPEQKGWPNTSQKWKSVGLHWEGDAAIIALPAEFTGKKALAAVARTGAPPIPAVKVSDPAGRPAGLKLDANRLLLGNRDIRLNGAHRKAFVLLERAWGEAVRPQVLCNELGLKTAEVATFMSILDDNLQHLGLKTRITMEGYVLGLAPQDKKA